MIKSNDTIIGNDRNVKASLFVNHAQATAGVSNEDVARLGIKAMATVLHYGREYYLAKGKNNIIYQLVWKDGVWNLNNIGLAKHSFNNVKECRVISTWPNEPIQQPQENQMEQNQNQPPAAAVDITLTKGVDVTIKVDGVHVEPAEAPKPHGPGQEAATPAFDPEEDVRRHEQEAAALAAEKDREQREKIARETAEALKDAEEAMANFSNAKQKAEEAEKAKAAQALKDAEAAQAKAEQEKTAQALKDAEELLAKNKQKQEEEKAAATKAEQSMKEKIVAAGQAINNSSLSATPGVAPKEKAEAKKSTEALCDDWITAANNFGKSFIPAAQKFFV
jgi:molecular chaperone DnaK (HSP70)